MTTINHHIAGQMGLPHIDRDGQCYLLTVGGEVLWDLQGNTALSNAQRNMGFHAWATRQGLTTDPQAAAIATGYAE